MHPLDFFQALTIRAATVVTKEVKNHGVWAANPICASSSSGLVPFAVNRARELAAAGRNVQVTAVGPDQYVCQYYDVGAVSAHVRRSLNMTMATCTCLEYQRFRFPCKDVFAGLKCFYWFNVSYLTFACLLFSAPSYTGRSVGYGL
jgi:hypothetical protein